MNWLKNKALIPLRWSEKYTRTDMVYLATGGFWVVVGQASVSIMVFLLAIAFAHFVPKEIYGEYKYLLSLVGILGAFTLTGLNIAVLQSVSRDYDKSVSCAFWKNIKWSIFFFIGAIAVSAYYFYKGNINFGASILILGSLWPFFISTNLYSPYLAAKKDFRRNSLYFDVLGNFFPSLAIFSTMLLTNNVVYLIASYIVSNTLIGIVLYTRALKIHPPNQKVDPEMMQYGKHMSLINVLNVVSNNIDQIFVFQYLGPIQLAIYNFAIAIPNQIKGPIKNLTNLIFPKFTERDEKEIRSGIKNKFFLLFLVAIFLIVVYFFAAPYIFGIFFPKYTDSIFYSRVFSLSLLWMISIPTDTYLSARKKIRELYASNISMSLLQIAAVFAGVTLGGLLGLVIARVIIRFSYSAASIYLYYKSSKTDLINND